VSPLGLAVVVATISQQPSTFAAGVEAVYVDAFVTDRKGPVTGLTASDFVLRDDGALRHVELVAVDTLPLPTLLVLDTSGSVAGEKLRQLQAAAHVLVQRLHGDQVGLLTFGNEIRFRVPFTTDTAQVEAAMAGIRAAGATALYDALYAATLVSPPRGRALLVLFTDGEDNLSWLERSEVQHALEISNTILQAVGIVPDDRPTSVPVSPANSLAIVQRRPDEPTHVRRLRQLAESTGGRFWAASAPDKIAAAFGAILDAMKSRYVLRFEPARGRQPGRHALEVTLARGHGVVHCRKAYFIGVLGPKP
jgi:VWFA-related protein